MRHAITLLVLTFGVASVAFGDCASQPWTFASSYVTTNCGNVGIGVTSPSAKFEMNASASVLNGKMTNTLSTGSVSWLTQNDIGYAAEFGSRGSARPTYGALQANDGYAYANSSITIMADGANSALKFAAGGNTERMRITPDGVITIGQPTNVESGDKLVVNGKIRATSVIGAVFQDLAEWVPATEPMPAGTVVIVDSTARNTVRPSARSYDTRVAGVVSAQPGLILGVESPDKAMIATTGRVKVRVDASHSPIAAGDLLVTSGKPGVAMRSEPVDLGGVPIHRPGTLIGKALEPLARGEGEILVLLSLQ